MRPSSTRRVLSCRWLRSSPSRCIPVGTLQNQHRRRTADRCIRWFEILLRVRVPLRRSTRLMMPRSGPPCQSNASTSSRPRCRSWLRDRRRVLDVADGVVCFARVAELTPSAGPVRRRRSRPLRFHHRCTKPASLCFSAACHVRRSEGPRTYVSRYELRTSPCGVVICTGTSATGSSDDWCRAVTMNHNLSRLIGPPIEPVNIWMCLMPLAVRMLFGAALRASSTLSLCHSPLLKPMNAAPLNSIAAVLQHASSCRIPPPDVSAGIALVMIVISDCSMSSK